MIVGVNVGADQDTDPTYEDRGTLVLVIEESIAEPLAYEIERLKQDLIGDGWYIKTETVESFPNNDAGNPVTFEDSGIAVWKVKEKIKNLYDDPLNEGYPQVRAVFLLGNVPVPYSGYHDPDGHGKRTMPADLYYGDVDTDLEPHTIYPGTVDETMIKISDGWADNNTLNPPGNPSDPVYTVTNEPNDGRFDQSSINDSGDRTIELTVGRIDFSNMVDDPTEDFDFSNDFPGMDLSGSVNAFALEVALLRRYLDKDHAYRQGRFEVAAQAFVVGPEKGDRSIICSNMDLSPFSRPWITSTTPRCSAVLAAER